MKTLQHDRTALAVVVTFLTFAAFQASAVGTWYTSSWSSGFTPASDNILLGKTPDPASGLSSNEGSKVFTTLTDGEAGVKDKSMTTCLGNNASLTYTLEEAKDIDEIRIYSTWADTGRDTLSVASIQAETQGGETVTLSPNSISFSGDNCCACATLKMANSTPLCADVKKIVFNFGSQENTYVGYAELEAVVHRDPSGGYPFVWHPANVLTVWDSATYAWMSDGLLSTLISGGEAVFNGEEPTYVRAGEIMVVGTPEPSSVTVSGSRDYTFIGDVVDTSKVVKDGTGTLAVDGGGFSTNAISLNGGSFEIRPYAADYVADGLSISVGESAVASIASTPGKGTLANNAQFAFCYKSGSTNWDSTFDYTTTLGASMISGFISNGSPTAPDGVSLSGKSVWVTGRFYVSSQDAGEWSFSGRYDDSILLKVDGTQILRTASYTQTQTGTATLAEGWHSFEIRAYDGSGGWGYAGCINAKSPQMSDYANFHEQNFNMAWCNPDIDNTIAISGIDIDLDVASGATLTFASPGFNVRSLTLAADASLALDVASIPVGATFVSASDSATLAALKAQFQTSIGGYGTVIETADGLALSPAGAYCGVGGWNTMANWDGGTLPGAADTAYVVGSGTVLSIDDGAATMPAAIIVAEGATLRVETAVELPPITLSGTGSLVFATDMDWSSDGYTPVVDGAKVPAIAVAEGATLSVPGGTKFGGVRMDIRGTIAVTNSGDIVFGYAEAGEMLPFGLSINGGTVTNNFGNIDFACPAVGGVVKAAGDAAWTITDATLMPDYDYGGFNFGYNNLVSEHIEIDVNGTDLTYIRNNKIRYSSGHGVFYLAGGVSVVFGNGSRLYKQFAADGGVNQHIRFNVNGRGQFVFNEGSEMLWEAGSDGSSVGSGLFCLEPDEEGFESLVVNNATFFYYRLKSNGNAVLRLNNATYSGRKVSWNYVMPFQCASGKLKGVVLEGTNVYERADSSSPQVVKVPVDVPLSGTGGLRIAMSGQSYPIDFTITNGANAATGALTVDEGCALTLASGANWSGTVDYADNLIIADWNTLSAAEITVGGLYLKKPLVYRVWEDGNDKINFTGAGIVPNGHEVMIALQNAYVPTAGTAFDLGTVPADFDLSSIINSNNKWTYSLAAIEDDDAHKTLKVTATSVDYTFDGGSGETTVVDLNDPAGWRGGSVPTGQDVAIDGVAAVAEGSIASFSSIVLKNGASLTVRKPAVEPGEEDAYAGTTLPAVELREGTALTVEANAAATMTGALTIFVADGGETLPSISVAVGGVLNILGGTKFKNCRLLLDGGTLATTTDGGMTFGYALPDETAHFSMAATNATILSHHDDANTAKNASRIDFASPEDDGEVVLDAPVDLFSTTVTINNLDGYAFGFNNPTSIIFKVIADNTRLDYGAETTIAGGANLVLTNNATLYHIRNHTTDKRTDEVSYPLIVKEFGRITLIDGGSIKQPICHIENDYKGAVILNPSEVGWAGIEVLDGGLAEWRKINGSKTATGQAWSPVGSVAFADGTLRIGKGFWWGWVNGYDDLLYRLSAVEIQYGTTMTLVGVSQTYGDSGEANLKFVLDSPFTGAGNLVVANTCTDQTMQPVIMSGANSNTGTVEALLPVNGNRETYLYFQDGANWAGTVVGNSRILIVDKVTGSTYTHNSPVAVSFGALDLQADFPVKVWKPDGEPMTNDTLNVGTYLNNGGRLVLELATDGVEFSIGDSVVVGKIAKDGALPRVPAGWVAKKQAIDGDDANDDLILKRGIGLQVLVR